MKDEINVEDIYLDNAFKRREEEIEDIKMEVPLKRTNFFILIFFILILLGALLGFSLRLQAENEEYRELAERNKYISFHYASERGIVYDRNMNQLVHNEASFNLFLDKSKVIKGAFPSFLISDELFKKALESTSSEEVLLKKNLSHQDLVLFEARKEDFPFLEVRKNILRKYERDACLGHVLGYLGKVSKQELDSFEEYDLNDYIGKAGLEKVYESILKEKKGVVQVERTADGEEISRKIVSLPQSGESIVLSLDLDLQKKAVQSLSSVLNNVGSEKGVVIALDPRNGEVLSLVSLPCYDNNLFSGGISIEDWERINQDENNPQLNRAIGGVYPTGSTIKPFIALAALEEGVVEEDTSLYCPSELCIENQYNPDEAQCFPDWEYHGWSDIKRAIAESVNPFFYMLGGGYTSPGPSSKFYNAYLPKKLDGLGAEKLAFYLKKFSFGEEAGIDLEGEMKGRVPSPEWKEEYFSTALEQKWYLGDSYNLSIGQGYLLSTPLQLANAVSMIANNGALLRPHFLKKEKEVLKEYVASLDSLRIVREGMRQTVSSGSATRLNSLEEKCAAKTGTAQVYSNRDIYHNWIAVFSPYENPEIVLVVLIEEVEGIKVAAQNVAKDILSWYFSSD